MNISCGKFIPEMRNKPSQRWEPSDDNLIRASSANTHLLRYNA